MNQKKVFIFKGKDVVKAIFQKVLFFAGAVLAQNCFAMDTKYTDDDLVINLTGTSCQLSNKGIKENFSDDSFTRVLNSMFVHPPEKGEVLTFICPLPLRAMNGYGKFDTQKGFDSIKEISMDVLTIGEGNVRCRPFSVAGYRNDLSIGSEQAILNDSTVVSNEEVFTWDNPFSFVPVGGEFRLWSAGIECSTSASVVINSIQMIVEEAER